MSSESSAAEFVWSVVDAAVAGDAETAASLWAASGLMHLTGNAEGPALVAPARLAPAVRALTNRIAELTAHCSAPVVLDGPALLAERGAIAALTRNGAISAGGSCRLLRARDHWVALNLARDADWELLHAWLETAANSCWAPGDGGWKDVAKVVASRSGHELRDRALLLGLPFSICDETSTFAAPAHFVTSDRKSIEDMLVVDFSALWAGPLCAHILGLAGAHVIKVESITRPDGARGGPPAFFNLLHAGHDSIVVDFACEAEVAQLRNLVLRADIVIEASRPRGTRDPRSVVRGVARSGLDRVVARAHRARSATAARRQGWLRR